MKIKTRRTLDCCCCGIVFKGYQHWNQDKGYGLCDDCMNEIYTRDVELYGKDLAKETMLNCYGRTITKGE